MLGGEDIVRLIFVKLLARLGDKEKLVAPRAQKLSKPLLRRAIGRRGIEKSDAVLKAEIKQRFNLGIGGQRKAVAARIFHARIAPELDGAEAQYADTFTCIREGSLLKRHAAS